MEPEHQPAVDERECEKGVLDLDEAQVAILLEEGLFQGESILSCDEVKSAENIGKI